MATRDAQVMIRYCENVENHCVKGYLLKLRFDKK